MITAIKLLHFGTSTSTLSKAAIIGFGTARHNEGGKKCRKQQLKEISVDSIQFKTLGNSGRKGGPPRKLIATILDPGSPAAAVCLFVYRSWSDTTRIVCHATENQL